jgi:hypothetical protein
VLKVLIIGSLNIKGKVNWDFLIQNCILYKDQKRKREETSELRYDPKFIEICKSIHRSPKYQYQLMQIVLQLDPDVLAEAHKAELHQGFAC